MPAPDRPLRLPVRQYIAVPSGSPRGLVTETWELPRTQVAFVELHCWNFGVPGGVPVPDDYWVFMGSKQNHVRMAGIVKDVIAPGLAAARQAGVPTVHVQPDSVANRYPDLRPARLRRAAEGPACEAEAAAAAPAPVRASNHAVERAQRVHGPGYMQWEGWSKLDVAPAVAPQAGDVMVASTEELHAWLQERHITTLVYTGFCANLCIIDSPAAMRAMNNLGYRCVLVREGTMAIEFADQPPNLHTDSSLRYIEAWIGYTMALRDLMRELRL